MVISLFQSRDPVLKKTEQDAVQVFKCKYLVYHSGLDFQEKPWGQLAPKFSDLVTCNFNFNQ